MLTLVIDTQPPAIDCPITPFIADINPDSLSTGAVVDFNLDIQDNTGPSNLNIQTTPLGSGDVFPYGRTLVVVNATDAAGNAALCNFNIIVRGEFWLVRLMAVAEHM